MTTALTNPGQDKILKAASYPKIKQYPETTQTETTAKTVAYLADLLGVTAGKVEHLNALNKHINTEYQNATYQEIVLAFQIYVKGELDLEPYQVLNAVTFGRVMAAYQKQKEDRIRRANQSRAAEPLTSEDEKTAIMQKAYQDAKAEMETGQEWKTTKHHVYDWLIQTGQIPEPSPREKKQAFEDAKQIQRDELEHERYRDMDKAREYKRRILEISEGNERTTKIAKTLILRKHLENGKG